MPAMTPAFPGRSGAWGSVLQGFFPGGRLPPVLRAVGRCGPPVPSALSAAPAPAGLRSPGAAPPLSGPAPLPVRRPPPGVRAATPAAPAVPRMAQPAVNGQAFAVSQDRLRLRPRGSGQRLPQAVQSSMESLFGASFGDVRVHVGPEAPSIGALAFTLGSDVYFAPGQYDPHTPRGQQLLAHELTHVVQQRQGRVRNPFGDGIAVVQDRALEAEAERMGLMGLAMLAQPRPALRPAGGPAPAAG